jgi:predicted acylesterase/phospholipase RssA
MTSSIPSERPARLGLALSGGGFRASLFHIGALARLAELDLLRHVQVISTVSGGSIIGALLYLHLRRLLQEKADAAIRPVDYVALVDEIQRSFPAAVARNLRMRTFADLRKNLRMWRRDYSRSDRMAELYEEYFYAPVVEPALRDGVPLPRLVIQPPDEGPRFHPFAVGADGRSANDRRDHKIPALVINTTTLNTGHNFQFTASWLGEPPARPDQGDVDRNLRLRRAYYAGDNLPSKYQRLPLAVAVAASAAVPGIFPPLALTDLYPTVTPQLVDGGAHDNQGLEGLLDLACTHVIVSDASGQMDDVDNPDVRMAAVLKRSNDTLMDRVREEQFAAVSAMQRHGELRRLCFFHMKEGLPQPELTWLGGADKQGQGVPPPPLTACGVAPSTQNLLARIRTDLDAFSEVEAHALMADGYLIARQRLDDGLCADFGAASAAAPAHAWRFLDALPYLRDPALDPSFARQLAVGANVVGKSLRLVPWLGWTAAVGVVAALLALGATLVASRGGGVLHALALAGAVLLGAGAVYRWGRRLLQGLATRLPSAVLPALASPVGAMLALAVDIHLRSLTVLRLRRCRIADLRPPARSADPSSRDRQAA